MQSSRAQHGNIVVVDGYSSGRLLAPRLRQRGYEVVHVRSSSHLPESYTAGFAADAYVAHIDHADDVAATLRAVRNFSPLAVMVGGESGVALSDALSEQLHLTTNGTRLSAARRNKGIMGECVAACGLRTAHMQLVRDVGDLFEWRESWGGWPIVLKPPTGANTQDIHFCHSNEEMRAALRSILQTRERYSGQCNTSALAQEYLLGKEYAVNTVSVGGQHIVTDIWQYDRHAVAGAATVYDQDRLLPFAGEVQAQLVPYCFAVLDALGIQHGPAHSEIKLTPHGPTLVETGARLCGVLTEISAAATDRDSIDLAISSYLDPDAFRERSIGYVCHSAAMMVFLQSTVDRGVITHRRLREVFALPGVQGFQMKPEGTPVTRTTNGDTTVGTIELRHEDSVVLDATLATIRDMEAAGAWVE